MKTEATILISIFGGIVALMVIGWWWNKDKPRGKGL